MGVLDKIMFWKKEDEPMPEFKLPEPPEKPVEMEHFGMPKSIPGISEPPVDNVPPAFAQPSRPEAFSQQSSMSSDQQLQLISSKLDTIKAQLETVLQRLERKEDQSPYQQRWRNV